MFLAEMQLIPQRQGVGCLQDDLIQWLDDIPKDLGLSIFLCCHLQHAGLAALMVTKWQPQEQASHGDPTMALEEKKTIPSLVLFVRACSTSPPPPHWPQMAKSIHSKGDGITKLA